MAAAVIVTFAPLPPPPPLSTVNRDLSPLYFLIGLLSAYLVVAVGVLLSFRRHSVSEGEQLPLQRKEEALAGARRPKSGWGKASHADADAAQVEALRNIDGWVRAAFIRKVFSILSTQLLLTTAVIVGMIYAAFVAGDATYPSAFGSWIAYEGGYLLSWLVLIPTMLVLCALMSCKDSYPLNLAGLFAFTVGMALLLGVTCVRYYGSGLGLQLLLAFIITTATFLALTAFTIFSRIDFSFLGPALCALGAVLMLWSLIMTIAFLAGGWSASWSLVFVLLGVCLFVGFIVYDTYMIVTRLGVDDYMLAAVELYTDVINLFLMVLSLLALCGGSRQ
jgi:FtsH-binding integral membrane protein